MRPDALCVITLLAARALGGRHLPLVGRGLDQHLRAAAPPSRTYSCDVADAAAAAGREIAPDALARDALAGRRIFGRDLRPVAFELFGDELGEAGERALAHLGARDADDDGVVGLDHDPGVDFRRAVGGARRPAGRRTEGRGRAQGRRRRRRCRRRRSGDSSSACNSWLPPFTRWPRRGSPRAPAGRCRSGRCW